MSTFCKTSVLLLLLTQAKPEPRQQWELAHDQAAVYQVNDALTGAALREFWLLGCELEGPIDVLNPTDIPLRYAFHLPKEKLKTGTPHAIKDRYFSECVGALPPIEVSGVYQLRPQKPVRLEEFFRSLPKSKKDKLHEPVEAAVFEGHFQAFRGNWLGDRVGSFERSPSATFTTSTVVRLSDGVILGASYQWTGRSEEYSGTFSAPAVGRRTIARDLIFKEKIIELSKAGLKERIESAIDRGVKWLRTTQSTTGTFTEPQVLTDQWAYAKDFVTALSLMALSHSGLPLEDKSIRLGFAYLDSRKLIHTWDIGLALMALESKYLPVTFYEDLADYSEERAREKISKALSRADKLRAEELTAVLLGYQGKNGGFGYSDQSIENIQTTQYAILGLKSASRMGIAIPPKVWRATVRYLESTVATSGQSLKVRLSYADGRKQTEKTCYESGWTYRPSPDPRTLPPRYVDTNGTRVMTALACVGVCRSELRHARALDEDLSRRLEDLADGGLGWWARHSGMRTAQQEGCIEWAALTYFYLWSTERAAVLLGIDRINAHSWYFEGAAHILAAQAADGHWDGSRGLPIADTAFAVLFLKRATVPVETPVGGGKRMVPTDGKREPATPNPDK